MNNEEASDKLQHWIDGDGPMSVDAVETAITALRSTPPATGAAAMREAEKVCSDVYDGYMVAAGRANTEARYDDEKDEMLKADGALRCLSKVRALPAPEVPDQMAAFGAAAWGLLKTRYGAAEMCEGDEAFIELALKAGLCTRQPYDREQHGYVEDADEGDMIYVWGNR